MHSGSINSHSKALKSVLFKITSKCNQSCAYCSEQLNISRNRPDLFLKQIKENFEYLHNNENTESVILSGGEPTLHPQYFQIVEYFLRQNISVKIITNMVKFNEEEFYSKHINALKKGGDVQFYASMNRRLSPATELNFSGLKLLLRANPQIDISIIITGHKNNLEDIPILIEQLNDIFARKKNRLRIELRLVYIEEVCDAVVQQAPLNFIKVKEVFNKSAQVALSLSISMLMWNFPICYLEKNNRLLNSDMDARIKRKIIKIDPDNQQADCKMRDFQDFFYKNRHCTACKYFKYCSGINFDYIEKFNFPGLKAMR